MACASPSLYMITERFIFLIRKVFQPMFHTRLAILLISSAILPLHGKPEDLCKNSADAEGNHQSFKACVVTRSIISAKILVLEQSLMYAIKVIDVRAERQGSNDIA